MTIRRILKGVRAKNLEAPLLMVDSFKVFSSEDSEKTEIILPAFGSPKDC